MSIAGIAGSLGAGAYRISSVHGNPYSMDAIQRIGRDGGKSGRPLVIASKEPQDGLYVKDYGELRATKSTATGGSADMLSIQESMLSRKGEESRSQKASYASYLNDTIGMMGLANRVRDQLSGTGSVPFA